MLKRHSITLYPNPSFQCWNWQLLKIISSLHNCKTKKHMKGNLVPGNNVLTEAAIPLLFSEKLPIFYLQPISIFEGNIHASIFHFNFKNVRYDIKI